MRLMHSESGGLHEWSDTRTGAVIAVGGDADRLVGMFESRVVNRSWRLFGSPDQDAGIYLAVRPDAADAHWLQGLETDAGRLLPSNSVGWMSMSLDDLREHTSGSAVGVGQVDFSDALAAVAQAEEVARRAQTVASSEIPDPTISPRCP